jgi:ABC-type multidrug transport system fused ATPase/permease subunit
MFSMTVRFNLDPFNNYSDTEIWEVNMRTACCRFLQFVANIFNCVFQVLSLVEMSHSIMSLPNKLNELVAEGGENFSAGQRQVRICFS